MREARAEREGVRVKRAKDGGESEEGTTVAASDGRDDANDAATAGPNAGYPGHAPSAAARASIASSNWKTYQGNLTWPIFNNKTKYYTYMYGHCFLF